VRSDEGSVRRRIVVPANTPPGPFPIAVDDEEGASIELMLTVTE
jgi:hypothetical protein